VYCVVPVCHLSSKQSPQRERSNATPQSFANWMLLLPCNQWVWCLFRARFRADLRIRYYEGSRVSIDHLAILLSPRPVPVRHSSSSALLGILVCFLLENTSVIHTANIVLPQDAILRPEEQIYREPLQKGSSHAKEIENQALAVQSSHQVLDVQSTFVIAVVLSEEVFELLGTLGGSAQSEDINKGFIGLRTGIGPHCHRSWSLSRACLCGCS
jgi:hypothetical protein